MTNWLCITTSDNWKITKNENVLGFKERVKRQIFPIKNGDIGFIYLKTGSPDVKNPRVIAKFEFVSEIYKDDAPLFSPPKNYPRETFPLRCKIKILAVLVSSK